jgi:hypothetical protein
VTSPTGHLTGTSASIWHFGPIMIEDRRMIRATDSSPQSDPRRVRWPCWFSAAAIPRKVCPRCRSFRIAAKAACSLGSGSRCLLSADSRYPYGRLPTRSPFARLWLIASRVRSPIASRSHWLTAVMMFITSRPAAELVSSDSATEMSDRPRRSNRSSTGGDAALSHPYADRNERR